MRSGWCGVRGTWSRLTVAQGRRALPELWAGRRPREAQGAVVASPPHSAGCTCERLSASPQPVPPMRRVTWPVSSTERTGVRGLCQDRSRWHPSSAGPECPRTAASPARGPGDPRGPGSQLSRGGQWAHLCLFPLDSLRPPVCFRGTWSVPAHFPRQVVLRLDWLRSLDPPSMVRALPSSTPHTRSRGYIDVF